MAQGRHQSGSGVEIGLLTAGSRRIPQPTHPPAAAARGLQSRLLRLWLMRSGRWLVAGEPRCCDGTLSCRLPSRPVSSRDCRFRIDLCLQVDKPKTLPSVSAPQTLCSVAEAASGSDGCPAKHQSVKEALGVSMPPSPSTSIGLMVGRQATPASPPAAFKPKGDYRRSARLQELPAGNDVPATEVDSMAKAMNRVAAKNLATLAKAPIITVKTLRYMVVDRVKVQPKNPKHTNKNETVIDYLISSEDEIEVAWDGPLLSHLVNEITEVDNEVELVSLGPVWHNSGFKFTLKVIQIHPENVSLMNSIQQ
ncbi:uncharacterized protein LOC133903677 [Phragmites australis]|uniref:uncharacterized protein LOC133903677 n=1 Tax=Phragmites australis TaxID=29695 RepID=UPI002D79304E|nr:uncharacterized protein LOC133903677 [Phragmites australis]